VIEKKIKLHKELSEVLLRNNQSRFEAKLTQFIDNLLGERIDCVDAKVGTEEGEFPDGTIVKDQELYKLKEQMELTITKVDRTKKMLQSSIKALHENFVRQ